MRWAGAYPAGKASPPYPGRPDARSARWSTPAFRDRESRAQTTLFAGIAAAQPPPSALLCRLVCRADWPANAGDNLTAVSNPVWELETPCASQKTMPPFRGETVPCADRRWLQKPDPVRSEREGPPRPGSATPGARTTDPATPQNKGQRIEFRDRVVQLHPFGKGIGGFGD